MMARTDIRTLIWSGDNLVQHMSKEGYRSRLLGTLQS